MSELAIEYTDVDGKRRRVQIIPDCSGREGWRITSVWTGTSWRETGREPISDVEIEAPGGVRSWRGP